MAVVYILKRLWIGILFLLCMMVGGLWILSCIPGTSQDLNAMSEESKNQLVTTIPVEIPPIFYFSLLPTQNNLAGSSLADYFPHFKWNGIQNQFHPYFSSFCRGDLGQSTIDSKSVNSKIIYAICWSMSIQLPAYLGIIFFALWFSKWVRLNPQNHWIKSLEIFFIAFHSIPVFWLATLLLVFFSGNYLHLFPSSFINVSEDNPFVLLFISPHYFILPILSIFLSSMAYVVNVLQNGYKTALESGFWIRVKSSGILFKEALSQEAFPIAIIPFIAWLASLMPILFTGSILVENIFNVPGLGRLLFQSIQWRDWPTVQGIFLLTCGMTILGFIFSDLLLFRFDPRTNIEQG